MSANASPTMFRDALGADDSELHRATAVAFMVGAVKRTYEPGCQHDWAPVLIGGQGSGKSTFCRELMPEGHDSWYSVVSSLAQEVQKQVEQIGGAVLVEFKEMRGAGRYEAVKSYIDTGVDIFRPPYARTSERHKRRWVGIGTGNDEGQGVLPDDPTGNRRYVAIPVSTPGDSQEDRAATSGSTWRTTGRNYGLSLAALPEQREKLSRWGVRSHERHTERRVHAGQSAS